MKKLVLGLLFLMLALTLVSAANNTEEKAYSCLETKVKNQCSSLPFEEQVFSFLALSYNSAIRTECKNAIKSKALNNECWPSSGCKIKDTALAVIALNYAGENTKKAEDWLSSKNKSADLEWYLEIDSSEATECKIKYDSLTYTINIAENKKVSGNPGDCLSLAYDNYWLKINSGCLQKEFKVSCNKNFISTLLYKKTGSNVWHISSDVQSESASGETKHKINALCFGLSSCEYEASLWATLALQKTGNDISLFSPYLVSLAPDNEKYFPSTFLLFLTGSDEYLQEVLLQQKSQGYWELQEKFFDTALAFLSLPEEAETKAKIWLEENQDTTGSNKGCWNNGNIKDTAFLLWAGWPKNPSSVVSGEIASCEPSYYCVSKVECDEADGKILKNYACSGLNICCDKPKKQETCDEKNGAVCPSGKTCSLPVISTSDENNCCVGECEEETQECEKAGYNCRTSCLESEEESDESCQAGAGKICCKVKVTESGSLWWLWLLIILIILVILGIIFRNRLRLLIFKFKGSSKSGPAATIRPGFPPSPPMFRRPMMRQAITKPGTKTDKELEETLEKLRQMSK